MKTRVTGIILALALCAAIVVPAFAAETTEHDPLDGAAVWAVSELESALHNNLIFDYMVGGWTEPILRASAADAICKLIESITDKTIGEIARENGYDRTDCFIDTENEYAHFLKQSGISNGVDGVRYDPGGYFTRAQMVTMLGRMAKNLLGVDTASYPKGSTQFSDVPDWADEFVGWASAVGITDGVGGGRFDSNGVLQNQHTGVFIWRTFAQYYKSPYELLLTGEYITIGQMDILKAEASRWQSAIAIVGGFAEIVAIDLMDGFDQQLYLALRRFDPVIGEYIYDKGYEKIQVKMPDGVESRILSAESGAGSGELVIGIRFITEDSERIELFYADKGGIEENKQFENITIFQWEYIWSLEELPLEERQFK